MKHFFGNKITIGYIDKGYIDVAIAWPLGRGGGRGQIGAIELGFSFELLLIQICCLTSERFC